MDKMTEPPKYRTVLIRDFNVQLLIQIQSKRTFWRSIGLGVTLLKNDPPVLELYS